MRLSKSGAASWGQTEVERTSTVTGVLLLAAGSICAVILGVGVLVLVDLARGRTRWQERRRQVFFARVRFIERVGRTPEDLNRDRAAVLGRSTRELDRMPPEVLGAQLRLALTARGASWMQASYLRSPATEDFLAGRAPLPPVEDLAREALLEHLVSDGIALPHDHEYLAAKTRMPVEDWIALPHQIRQQATTRLFDLVTEMPYTVEDVDRTWQAVFLRRGLSLLEWRSVPLRERHRQAEAYLATHPDLIPLELTYRALEGEDQHPILDRT